MRLQLRHRSSAHSRNARVGRGLRCVICLPVLSGVAILVLTVTLVGCSGAAGAGPDLSGNVVVSGSTALQPLVAAAAPLFQQIHPQVHIDVQGGGSLSGLQAVSSGKVDIGDSDIYADPAAFPDPRLTDHLVCIVPFAMIVNSAVSVSSLSRDEIVKIFSTGEITNWKQVGGPDLAIVPVVRPATSGTRATFRKYILQGRDENGKLLTTDSSQTVRDTVAHTAGAIGYLALSVLDASVHVVAIDNQLPTAANISGGRYAFWGFEHMYTLGDNGGAVGAFLDYMLTSPIQRLAQQLGYIPISSAQLAASPPSTTTLPLGITADVPRRVRGGT